MEGESVKAFIKLREAGGRQARGTQVVLGRLGLGGLGRETAWETSRLRTIPSSRDQISRMPAFFSLNLLRVRLTSFSGSLDPPLSHPHTTISCTQNEK